MAEAVVGIAARWSEHVRELETHRNRTVIKKRRRRRYVVLSGGASLSCLNYIIYGSAAPADVAGQEAVAIALAQMHASGHEFKGFNH